MRFVLENERVNVSKCDVYVSYPNGKIVVHGI